MTATKYIRKARSGSRALALVEATIMRRDLAAAPRTVWQYRVLRKRRRGDGAATSKANPALDATAQNPAPPKRKRRSGDCATALSP
jgi:hypothetical protein